MGKVILQSWLPVNPRKRKICSSHLLLFPDQSHRVLALDSFRPLVNIETYGFHLVSLLRITDLNRFNSNIPISIYLIPSIATQISTFHLIAF
uniref:Uncharacterized protein n=1 Tax=Gossypium raimondii TaxID=29730 RepID=A0A0D2QQM6_GOSRA|nr:hypothetical protein B456_007G108900 [Gossypium raimondii]